ncbi:MAG TPA: hypothetical protein VD713_04625, partial [Sphingomonadales bacterium]|nr:hypothetical protein [Sphingomonadales bacterium]
MKWGPWMFAAAAFAASFAFAQTLPLGEPALGASGLPLPRFASLAAGEANLRAGPGEQYPVQWVYRKKGYP